MNDITLSADERLIRSAREKASREKTSLNALFRKWLARYTEKDNPQYAYERLMGQLSYVRSGKDFPEKS